MSPKHFRDPSLTAACDADPNDASSEGLRSADGPLPIFWVGPLLLLQLVAPHKSWIILLVGLGGAWVIGNR